MPLSVQVVDQHLHFGTSMPLRVGAFIPLLTDRQTPLVSWGPTHPPTHPPPPPPPTTPPTPDTPLAAPRPATAPRWRVRDNGAAAIRCSNRSHGHRCASTPAPGVSGRSRAPGTACTSRHCLLLAFRRITRPACRLRHFRSWMNGVRGFSAGASTTRVMGRMGLRGIIGHRADTCDYGPEHFAIIHCARCDESTPYTTRIRRAVPAMHLAGIRGPEQTAQGYLAPCRGPPRPPGAAGHTVGGRAMRCAAVG